MSSFFYTQIVLIHRKAQQIQASCKYKYKYTIFYRYTGVLIKTVLIILLQNEEKKNASKLNINSGYRYPS